MAPKIRVGRSDFFLLWPLCLKIRPKIIGVFGAPCPPKIGLVGRQHLFFLPWTARVRQIREIVAFVPFLFDMHNVGLIGLEIQNSLI